MRPTPYKPTLLIADDDQHLRYLVAASAERSGAYSAVHTVPDGQAALEWIHDMVRDPSVHQDSLLVLSDLNMPRMDGVQLIRELKHDPATRDIPIVIMTSSNRAEDREEAQSAGCAAFYYKPEHFQKMGMLVASLPAVCEANLHASM